MADSIRVFAPATVANVTCGFDVLGFALDNPGDYLEARLSDEPGIRILEITGDSGKLSYEPLSNTASISIQCFLNRLGTNKGVEIKLHKNMPFGSGMGSSAASTVAGAFAVNELFGRPFELKELLPFVMEGERIACGHAHADNVAPSLLGGVVLVRSYEPLDVVNLSVPPELRAVVVHPHVEVKTSDSRNIVPDDLSLKLAVQQWGNLAGLVAGFMKPDYDLISRSMEDVVIEPHRAQLIPNFYASKEVALSKGALGFGISGSGPSMFALTNNKYVSEDIANEISKIFDASGHGYTVYHSKINNEGPRVIKD